MSKLKNRNLKMNVHSDKDSLLSNSQHSAFINSDNMANYNPWALLFSFVTQISHILNFIYPRHDSVICEPSYLISRNHQNSSQWYHVFNVPLLFCPLNYLSGLFYDTTSASLSLLSDLILFYIWENKHEKTSRYVHP